MTNELLDLLDEFESAKASACHEMAGALERKSCDEARRALVTAIERLQERLETQKGVIANHVEAERQKTIDLNIAEVRAAISCWRQGTWSRAYAMEQFEKLLQGFVDRDAERTCAVEPSAKVGPIQRVCHALTDNCVMFTDPERASCTPDNCAAVRAAERT